jgi:hypothetical protein
LRSYRASSDMKGHAAILRLTPTAKLQSWVVLSARWECGRGKPVARAGLRPGNFLGHIFLIFKYRRISGNDMTARSPRVAAAAAMVIAEMYPSVRIVCLLFFS